MTERERERARRIRELARLHESSDPDVRYVYRYIVTAEVPPTQTGDIVDRRSAIDALLRIVAVRDRSGEAEDLIHNIYDRIARYYSGGEYGP